MPATKLTSASFWSSPFRNQRRLVADEILKLRTNQVRRHACIDGPVVYYLDVVCGMLLEGLGNAIPLLPTCSHTFFAAGGACLRARSARVRDHACAHALGQGRGRGVEVQEASMARLVNLTASPRCLLENRGVELQHVAREASMAELGACPTAAWFRLLYAAGTPFHPSIHVAQASMTGGMDEMTSTIGIGCL